MGLVIDKKLAINEGEVIDFKIMGEDHGAENNPGYP